MILVICGPTGSGKSALALKLAEKFNGEIINGDAFQIYRDFNIGTAKPSKEDLKRVPHHLFDFLDPCDHYSPYQYQKDARQIIEEIESRHHLPIIVGGSGNYQKALLFNYQFEEYEDPDLSMYDGMSDDELYDKLREIDPESAQKIHPHNRKRVMRALAIYLATGQKKSQLDADQKHELVYETLLIGINIERETLYQKIDKRVEDMLDQGLFEEVKTLYEKYGPEVQAFQAIGYKEWKDYFANQRSYEEVVRLIQQHSRNYAKRQMTYFANQLPVNWFTDVDKAYKYISKLLLNRRKTVWKESN